MKINTYDAPHIRYHENTRVLMADAILTMCFIYIMGFYYYGSRVVMLGLVSVVTCVLVDNLCILMYGRRPHMRDLSSVVTGMMLPLLMPASIPYFVVVIAGVFAIAVAKQPFGGVGHNVFNPVAAGFAFVAISFGDKLYSYPIPLEKLPVFGQLTGMAATSPAYTLELGGVPKYDLVEMALGNFPGPVGATNILVILACLLYLVFRNTVRWEMPIIFLVTVAGMAWLFPRLGAGLDGVAVSGIFSVYERLQSVMFEMMSGVLLFGGVFLLGDPVTTPKRDWSKCAYAVVAGVMVMLFRRYGNLEEEFVFAILLMNATVWGFDMMGERLASFVRGKKLEIISGKKIQKKA